MYCSAPWTTVQIKNDGQFSYCCMSRDPMSYENNGDELVAGRKKMIDGEILPVCQTKCFDIEHLFSSQRFELNRRWPIKNPIAPIADPKHIEYIDLRMGNICNFMCLMCGDRDSHLWGKAFNKEQPYISWTRNKQQYDTIINFISSCKNLKSISLAGGEPFYNKKHLFDVIDNLPRNIDLKFITNVSYCDDEIIDKLNEFKTGRLHCSVDGVGRWIEIQRMNSNWNLIEKNLFKFATELHKDWLVKLVPTFTVINTYGVTEFIDWYINQFTPKRQQNLAFAYTVCMDPKHMTMYNIPLSNRIELAQSIRDINVLNNPTIKRLADALCSNIQPEVETIPKLQKYFSFLNNNLNINVAERIPEIRSIVE